MEGVSSPTPLTPSAISENTKVKFSDGRRPVIRPIRYSCEWSVAQSDKIPIVDLVGYGRWGGLEALLGPNCRCPGRWNPPSPSTCYPTRLRLSQWLSGLAGKLVEQRRQVAQEGCAVPSQSQSSEVLQQCSVVSSGDWASVSVGNSVSKVSDPSTSRCVSTLEWHDASLQSFVFVIPEFLL